MKVLLSVAALLLCSAVLAKHDSERDSKSSSGSDDSGVQENRRHDNEDECNDCQELERTCRNYEGTQRCFKPRITYVKSKKGCRQALISCRHGETNGPFTLESSSGDVMFYGYGTDKLAKCSKRGRWHAEDVNGDLTSFRKVHCLEKSTDNGSPYVPPSYGSKPTYGEEQAAGSY